MSNSSIFDTYLEKRVRGFVRPRVPREDIDDVVQDACLRIVKNESKYDPKRGPVWPWAKYHCQSAISEYYRHHQPDQDVADINVPIPPAYSSSDYEHLLEVTFTAPSDLHQLLVFGFATLLEWKPAEIVAELSDQALEDLGNRFVVAYSSHFTHDRNRILDLLRPFTERLRAERSELAGLFSDPDDKKKCAAEVSRWCHTVKRRVRSDLLRRAAKATSSPKDATRRTNSPSGATR